MKDFVKKEELQEVISLRAENRLDEALQLALKLYAQYPENPQVNYQCAWTYDTLGEECNAVAYYERAIALGLSGKDRRGALLGLGSTYRNIGEHGKSAEILRDGISEYVDGREFEVFLALTLYDKGEYSEAVRLLLRNLAETTQSDMLKQYQSAILFYSDNLE